MSREIPLTQGRVAIIDDNDYELVSQYKWYYSDMGYALWRGNINGQKKTIRMHRLINSTPDDLVTDHINRDRLDNRRSNLRTVTQAENRRNIEQGRGYWYDFRTNKWVVEIYNTHVGVFSSEELAAQIAYMVYSEELPLVYMKEISKYCKWGHDKEANGLYGTSCRICILERQKEYFKRTYISRPKEFKEYCRRGHQRRLTINNKGDCTLCATVRSKERRCRLKQVA